MQSTGPAKPTNCSQLVLSSGKQPKIEEREKERLKSSPDRILHSAGEGPICNATNLSQGRHCTVNACFMQDLVWSILLFWLILSCRLIHCKFMSIDVCFGFALGQHSILHLISIHHISPHLKLIKTDRSSQA